MRADHHHLVPLRAAARDLGDHVVARAAGRAGVARVAAQAQAHGFLAVQRAHHRVVVLGDHHEGGHAVGLGRALARAAAHHPHDAVVPAADADRADHALVHQEPVEQRGELQALLVLPGVVAALLRGARARHREGDQVLHALGVVAVEIRLLARLVGAQRVGEHHLAAQLALELLQVGLGLELGEHGLALHRAAGPGRPGARQRVQRQRARAEHLDPALAELPAAAQVVHRLLAHVGDAPLAQALAGPVRGALVAGRIGQARADDLGQVVQGVHHLRAVQRLLPDAARHVQVHRLRRLRADRQRHGERERRAQQDVLHAAPRPCANPGV